MKVDDILNELCDTGMYNTDRMIYANALFYFGSIMLNGFDIRSTKGNIRFFGITLAPSSSGKDWAQSKVLEILFQGKDKTYAKQMERVAMDMWNNDYPFANGLPTNMTVSLEGSKEGLFKVAQGQANSGFGSLNLIANEMGRVVSSSSDLIEKTKELYDGVYKAKTIKGSADDVKECDIENIVANMLMFGSPAGINHESKAQIIELCKSGLYRRSYICNIEPSKQELKENKEPIKSLEWFKDYKPKIDTMKVSDEANERIKEIVQELLDHSNTHLYNDFIQADKSAINIIFDLANIMAFLEQCDKVSLEHIENAYGYFKLTRSTVSDVFKSTTVHDSIYKILKRTKQLARHELVELDDSLNISKTKWEDATDILRELCYAKNEYLHEIGSKVVKYSIEKLPINNLDKIKIGVTDQEGAYAINFAPYEIPFFGEGMSIQKLLTSDKSSFTTGHFEPSAKASEGHRRAESFISGQNMVAFDIDEGMTIEQAIEILKPYTYIIYTTKSHGIKPNDRFRILLPTKTEYFVDAEQHKQMYENLSKILGIISYDVATRNVSRLWFINKGCEYYENKAELLDVTHALPSTEAEEKIMPLIHQVLDDKEIDKRISGMYRWVLSSTSDGNRNSNLFRFGMFVKEVGEDYDYHLRKINDMLTDGVSQKEIDVLIMSVHKR